MYALCERCDHFTDDGSHLCDEIHHDPDEHHAAQPRDIARPLTYWRQHRPDLFHKHQDGLHGPNSEHHKTRLLQIPVWEQPGIFQAVTTNPTIEIVGNAGRLTVDTVTGLVLIYDRDEAECQAIAQEPGHTDNGYDDIVRIDIDEWKRFYVGEEVVNGDILDWGFWVRDGTYQEAEHDWRANFITERNERQADEVERVRLNTGSGI